MGKYIREMNMPSTNVEDWIDKVQEFYDFLTRQKVPEGVHAKIPKLSHKAAREVIWFLQEITEVIPWDVDFCAECGCIAADEGGLIYSEKKGKSYCFNCMRDEYSDEEEDSDE